MQPWHWSIWLRPSRHPHHHEHREQRQVLRRQQRPRNAASQGERTPVLVVQLDRSCWRQLLPDHHGLLRAQPEVAVDLLDRWVPGWHRRDRFHETEYANRYVEGYERGQHYGPGLIIRGKFLLSLEVFSCAAKVWCSRQEAMQRVLSPAGCCAVIRVSSHAFTSKVVEHLLSGMCSTATRRRAGSGTSGCRTSKLLLSLVV